MNYFKLIGFYYVLLESFTYSWMRRCSLLNLHTTVVPFVRGIIIFTCKEVLHYFSAHKNKVKLELYSLRLSIT